MQGMAASEGEDINERFGLNAQDRVFGLSSLSFDLSVYDAFAPFMWLKIDLAKQLIRENHHNFTQISDYLG